MTLARDVNRVSWAAAGGGDSKRASVAGRAGAGGEGVKDSKDREAHGGHATPCRAGGAIKCP